MGPGAPLRPPTDLRLASLLVPGGAQVGVLCRLQVGLTLGTMTWQLTQAGCPPPKPPLPQKSLSTSPALQRKLPLCWETPLTCVPSSCEPSESLAEEKWCLAHSADEETEAASRPDTCASRAPPGGPRRAAASSPGPPAPASPAVAASSQARCCPRPPAGIPFPQRPRHTWHPELPVPLPQPRPIGQELR